MKPTFLSNSPNLFQDLPAMAENTKPVYSLLVFEDVVVLHGFFDFVQKWAKDSHLAWLKPVKGLTPLAKEVRKSLSDAIRQSNNEIEISIKWRHISHRDKARTSCAVYVEFLKALKSCKQTAYSDEVQHWVNDCEVRFVRIVETISLTRN